MTTKVILCRGFVLCIGNLTPHEVLKNSNKVDTEVNQVVYTVSGSAVASSEGKQPAELSASRLVDVSDFAGSEITYTAGVDGLSWIAINPVPKNKRYQTQLVPGGSSIDVTADGAECAVVCLFGGVTVAGKTIAAQSYARILAPKVVTLEVPENSVALVIKTA